MKNIKIFVNKILSIIVRIFFIPFYLVGFLVKKDNNIWIFGSNNGEKYGENSKALFEYVADNKKEIRAIWLTKSKNIENKLNREGREVYNFYSLKGCYFSLIAKILIISNSFFDLPLFAYLFSCKTKIIQLWHGTPLKKLGMRSVSLFRREILVIIFLKYIGRHSDLMISATEKNIKIYEEIGHRNIRITGQPRNDYLLDEKRSKTNKKIFLYLPTYREYDDKFDFFFQYGFNLKKMDNFLHENNAKLIIKFHPVDKKRIEVADLFFGAKNIILTNIDDIYSILSEVDVLLTDYSSVYFDFLLLNRPIIFTCFDFQNYYKLRGFYYDYNVVTPGPKANNWNETVTLMEKILDGLDEYKNERQKINNEFNKYQDSLSSQRVFLEIKK